MQARAEVHDTPTEYVLNQRAPRRLDLAHFFKEMKGIHEGPGDVKVMGPGWLGAGSLTAFGFGMWLQSSL
ncbi:MAG: hypothetical protein JO240_09725 [Solirubrobacterales bacterium]|nr:hypothetical protein [Solirubrobacterales bacterium]